MAKEQGSIATRSGHDMNRLLDEPGLYVLGWVVYAIRFCRFAVAGGWTWIV